LGLFSSLKSPTAEEAFWNWFSRNSDRLFQFEKDQNRIFDELSTQMTKVNPDLTFEFGPVQNGRRDFVISAGGIKSSFPKVQSLFAAKPKLDKWNVIAFRPRRTTLHTISYNDLTIKPEQVKYLLFKDEDPNKVGILLLLDGYTDAKRTDFGQVGYLFLDEIIGEYDVEMSVGAIELQGSNSSYISQADSITRLADNFDNYFKK